MTVQALLLAVLVLATSVWVGGYLAIAVVARTATATLDPGARVMFFRTLGRRYLLIGVPALLIALIAGAVLLRRHDWDALLIVTVSVAAALLLLLAVAVDQARKMTRLRRRAHGEPADKDLAEQVTRSGHRAAALRAMLGLLSVALVALGAFLAIH